MVFLNLPLKSPERESQTILHRIKVFLRTSPYTAPRRPSLRIPWLMVEAAFPALVFWNSHACSVPTGNHTPEVPSVTES